MNDVRGKDDPRSSVPTTHSMRQVVQFLERRSAAGFFGNITLSYQNGKVVYVRMKQTMKPDEL